ncbi:MAG: hypothetical protein ABIF10_04610 [Candidatus Woesearchaeota archaeon]
MTDSVGELGRSSYLIFRNREHVRLRYPQGYFWAPSNCALTVGYNDVRASATFSARQNTTT